MAMEVTNRQLAAWLAASAVGAAMWMALDPTPLWERHYRRPQRDMCKPIAATLSKGTVEQTDSPHATIHSDYVQVVLPTRTGSLEYWVEPEALNSIEASMKKVKALCGPRCDFERRKWEAYYTMSPPSKRAEAGGIISAYDAECYAEHLHAQGADYNEFGFISKAPIFDPNTPSRW